MSARRLLLFSLTALALLLGPFAIAPRAAEAATYDILVDTVADNLTTGTHCNDLVANDCSLRQAIDRAQSAAYTDTDVKRISFQLFTNGSLGGSAPFVFLINSGSRLPAITKPNVQIVADVLSQPLVEIDGFGQDVVFRLQGANGLISGLSIYGATTSGGPNGGSGIYITGSGNTVEKSYIGLRADGSLPGRLNNTGIRIVNGASGNTIGNTGGVPVANYISGNTENGVVISNASTNTVQNNFVGLYRVSASPFTLGARPNGQYGIQITSDTGTSKDNIIGGASTALANIVGGNGLAGVQLSGTGTSGNSILANYIGIDRASDTDFGNSGDGVAIEDGAKTNTLGGSVVAPLVISGNTGYGVAIRPNGDAAPTGNILTNTIYVGLNRAGTGPLPNGLGGVRIEGGASNNSITGSSNNLRIGGNTGPGISITGLNTSGNQVSGTLIGIVPISGTGNPSDDAPNVGGVLIDNSARQTTLSGNTISANTDYGVRITGVQTTTLSANFIGLDIDRTAAMGNVGPGVDVLGVTSDTVIGGATIDTRNYIVGNSGPGVQISGATTVNTTVSNNAFGLVKNASADTSYTKAIANPGEGVLVNGGAKTTTISSNTFAGTAASSTGYAAVHISGTGTTTATVSLNEIGCLNCGIGTSGTPLSRPYPDGVLVDAGARVVDVLSNTIRFNLGQAVKVDGSDTRRVRIQYNRMAGNAGAIQLVGTSRYAGSGADGDSLSKPNRGIDPPVDNLASPLRIYVAQDGSFTGYVYTSTTTVVNESDITPSSACPGCRIQFFKPVTGSSESQGFEPVRVAPLCTSGSSARTDFAAPNNLGRFAGCIVGFSAAMPRKLLFTATDSFGNTSEFGELDIGDPQSAVTLTYKAPIGGAQSAAPSSTVTYTMLLNNNSNLDFNNLTYVLSGTTTEWVASKFPKTTPLTVKSKQTIELTVTVKLPVGSSNYVKYPKTDNTLVTINSAGRITKTLNLATSVLATPVLRVTPRTNQGSGAPTKTVPYGHTIYNDGNVDVIIDLASYTRDPADSGKIWQTTFSQNGFTVKPGEHTDFVVNVTVPSGAQQTDGGGNPVRATTYVTATARTYAGVTATMSETTGVDLVPAAEMDGDQSQSAAAGEDVIFFHTVRNTSNGVARFKLDFLANSGSTLVSFVSDNGVPLSPSGVFQLDPVTDDATGKINILRFRATFRVTDKLAPGQEEKITIFVRNNDDNKTIGGAAVVDTVSITVGIKRPRLWLPMLHE